MEEFPEEFQQLRQDYNGLSYPGDLPGDLGLIPVRPQERSGWRIGPSTARWLGLTAAAAAIALVASGAWLGILLHGSIEPVVAMNTGAQPVPGINLPAPAKTPPKTPANTAIASAGTKKTTTKSTATAAVDDSIPLWSDVDPSSTSLSVSAGLPSESLIMPTVSEIEAEKTAAQTAKTSSKSS